MLQNAGQGCLAISQQQLQLLSFWPMSSNLSTGRWGELDAHPQVLHPQLHAAAVSCLAAAAARVGVQVPEDAGKLLWQGHIAVAPPHCAQKMLSKALCWTRST